MFWNIESFGCNFEIVWMVEVLPQMTSPGAPLFFCDTIKMTNLDRGLNPALYDLDIPKCWHLWSDIICKHCFVAQNQFWLSIGFCATCILSVHTLKLKMFLISRNLWMRATIDLVISTLAFAWPTSKFYAVVSTDSTGLDHKFISYHCSHTSFFS